MKISELQNWLDKAFTKYGDIQIGCYDAGYAKDVEEYEELSAFAPRVIVPPEGLPGDSLTEEDENLPPGAFVTFFYD